MDAWQLTVSCTWMRGRAASVSFRALNLCYPLSFRRRTFVSCKIFVLSCCFVAATTFAQQPSGQAAPGATNPGRGPASAQAPVEPSLPYIPSLDVSAMDRSVDPCVDLYHYSCGAWERNN